VLASNLEGSSRAEGGVEGQVLGFAVGRAGLYVASPLAVGAGEAALAGLVAGQLVEGSLQALGAKVIADGNRLDRRFLVAAGGLAALILGRRIGWRDRLGVLL